MAHEEGALQKWWDLHPEKKPKKTKEESGGGDTGAGESIGGVPAHLLEKSKAARARWAAKKAG